MFTKEVLIVLIICITIVLITLLYVLNDYFVRLSQFRKSRLQDYAESTYMAVCHMESIVQELRSDMRRKGGK